MYSIYVYMYMYIYIYVHILYKYIYFNNMYIIYIHIHIYIYNPEVASSLSRVKRALYGTKEPYTEQKSPILNKRTLY